MPAPRATALVVGTTPDYVDHIARRQPGRALFLTDTALRASSRYEAPEPGSEIICDLRDAAAAVKAVESHVSRRRIRLSGVACFDCESMELASALADRFGLPYPSMEAVRLCRDKLRSKELWQSSGVDCPAVRRVRETADLADALDGCEEGVVLKPVCGSGSELVFHCRDLPAAKRALAGVQEGVQSRNGNRMYSLACETGVVAIAEQYVSGTEYSCDAVVDNGSVELIRVARKHRAAGPWLGTIRAYELPAAPDEIPLPGLADSVREAARSLGLRRAMCMVDFIERDGRAVFLEIAPRPGGDCLPSLIRHSCGLDMLGAALDFAEGRLLRIPPARSWEPLVGLRLHADREGVVAAIDTAALSRDRRVREVSVLRRAGDRVCMPPDDYDSWLLGHVVFRPGPGRVEDQCDEIAAGVRVTWA